MQTRHASWSFTNDREAAEHYANEPNDRTHGDHALHPTLIRARLSIARPFVNTPDDPFVDFTTLTELLGADVAFRQFVRHEAEVKQTNAWEDVAGQGYADLHDVKARAPALLDTLCVQIYPLLDCTDTVAELRAAGFDGAIHMGSGETMDATEYRVFDRTQIQALEVIKLGDDNTAAAPVNSRRRMRSQGG